MGYKDIARALSEAQARQVTFFHHSGMDIKLIGRDWVEISGKVTLYNSPQFSRLEAEVSFPEFLSITPASTILSVEQDPSGGNNVRVRTAVLVYSKSLLIVGYLENLTDEKSKVVHYKVNGKLNVIYR